MWDLWGHRPSCFSPHRGRRRGGVWSNGFWVAEEMFRRISPAAGSVWGLQDETEQAEAAGL